MNKTLVVNLYGGPGSGKSTTAYKLAGVLKEMGFKAELVTEYAKDVVWEENHKTLENQIYVFGNQHQRMWRLKDKVDVIITDSPLILSVVYNKDSEFLPALIFEEYNKFRNIDYFVMRDSEYLQYGRNNTREESIDLDQQVLKLLSNSPVNGDFIKVVGKKDETVHEIANYVKQKLI